MTIELVFLVKRTWQGKKLRSLQEIGVAPRGQTTRQPQKE